MMAYEKKPGQFSLFKNKYHEAGDTKPVMKGDGICPCCQKEIELAVWGKQDRNGEKFFSGKIQEPRRADHQNERPAPRPPDFVRKSSADMGREMDDEIPF
jgi:hypothetical protein